MDITLNNGRTYYQVEPTLASILCELKLADKYEKPAPPPEKAGWSNGVFVSSGRRNITVRDGASTFWFVGPPEKISEFEQSLPRDAGSCPENVRARYTSEYTPYMPESA